MQDPMQILEDNARRTTGSIRHSVKRSTTYTGGSSSKNDKLTELPEKIRLAI